MRNMLFMHQNEMDVKLRKFNDAINKLQELSKKEAYPKKPGKYIVIEPFESNFEGAIKHKDAIDYKFGKYLKGRIHVEKELWIIASIKNLIDYGYLKIEE